MRMIATLLGGIALGGASPADAEGTNYRSAFADYQAYRHQEMADWVQANAMVMGEAGQAGHGSHGGNSVDRAGGMHDMPGHGTGHGEQGEGR